MIINKKRINNLGIAIFLTAIAISIIISIYNSFILSQKYRYTIGTVYKFESGRGGPMVSFTYIINKVKYDEKKTAYEYIANSIDKRYYVKFYPANPKNSRILLDKPVADSIKEAPPEGWKEIPQYIFEFK